MKNALILAFIFVFSYLTSLKKLSIMLRLLYKIYVWLFFVPVFLFLTLITALSVIIGCLLGGRKIFAYYPGMIWSRLTCYLALCPIVIKGRENIQKGQPYIFVANHQGAFDIFLIYGFLGVPVKWFMKAGIGKIPLVGAACKAAGFVFLDSSSTKSAAKSIAESESLLRNGASLIIFPEGSRTYDGKMIRFKRGAFQMAASQNIPIIPITLNGPFDVMPIDTLNLQCHKMEMVIHPQIDICELDSSSKGLQELADQTREAIASALWEEYK